MDEMIAGAFHRFHHVHEFHEVSSRTLMVDVLTFSSPFGWLGTVVDAVLMKRYVTGLLYERNRYLKEAAEDPTISPIMEGA